MLLNIILILITWVFFIFTIFKIPYPETIIQANLTQLLAFFIPLYLALLFTFNIFLRNTFVSGSISLGIIFLLILNALNSFNLITGLLTVISVGLLISYFKKTKRSLTNYPKIPKLTRLKKGN